MPTPSHANPSILPAALRGIRFSVGDTEILKGIDLTLDPGGCIALIGYNGAGKSVLLRVLHGLLAPTEGEISWAGTLASKAVRQRQAMVFQHPVLLRRSVADNIRYALSRRGLSRAEQAARLEELLLLGELVHLADRPARALSGGERQRVAMVRALGTRPELLLLDEPTASLDPGSTGAIEQLIRKATELGTTAVLVTHNRGQAKRLARRVVFLHQGRVVEDLPTREFFEGPYSAPARAFTEGRLPDEPQTPLPP